MVRSYLGVSSILAAETWRRVVPGNLRTAFRLLRNQRAPGQPDALTQSGGVLPDLPADRPLDEMDARGPGRGGGLHRRRYLQGSQRGLLFLGLALVVITLAYQSKGPIQIAVGERSADPFVAGFSFRERAPFGTFRWSSAQAKLYLVQIGNQDGVLRIKLRAPQGNVSLWANGHLLTPQPIGSTEVKDYLFPVDRSWLGAAGTLILTLESGTFTAPPDTRQLGAQAVSVNFEPLSGPVWPAPLTVLYVVLATAIYSAMTRHWTGSIRAAYAVGALALIASAWGLWHARLEAAWLVELAFWLGLVLYGCGWLAAWLLRRFWTFNLRELRLVGLFCLAAFAARMPFAVKPGYVADVQDFVVWSYKLTHYGLASTYVLTDGLWNPNYPPVLLYTFQAIGTTYQKLFAPDFLYPVMAGDPELRAMTTNAALLADPTHRTLLRMPAILADLLTGALIFAMVRSKVTAKKAWLIAASYWFNPIVIYNSAVWGQVDATYTLFVVLAVGLMELEHTGWAFFSLAIGGLTKPQAFVLGPLLLVRAFQRQRWRGLSLASLGAALGLGLVVTPMIAVGAFPAMITRFTDWIGDYPQLSLNAHNLWWLVKHGSVAVEDTVTAFAGLSYRGVSLLLFGLVYGLALLPAWKRTTPSLWPIAAYISFAFFFLPTEMHENYGFPVLALLVMAITTEGYAAWLYAALTITMVVNYATHDPDVFARLGLPAPDAQLSNIRWANAVANTLIFVAWTAWGVMAAVRRPDRRHRWHALTERFGSGADAEQ
jgi:hypothetical protein